MNNRLDELMEVHNEQTSLLILLKQDTERLQAENTHLEEQNAQLVFATELLVKELNALKENITNSWRETTSDPPEITISP